MAGGSLADAGRGYRLFDGALDRGLVQVMSEATTCIWVDSDAGRWKEPLPGPFARGVRVLSLEAAR